MKHAHTDEATGLLQHGQHCGSGHVWTKGQNGAYKRSISNRDRFRREMSIRDSQNHRAAGYTHKHRATAAGITWQAPRPCKVRKQAKGNGRRECQQEQANKGPENREQQSQERSSDRAS
jgi:hypothetical protein